MNIKKINLVVNNAVNGSDVIVTESRRESVSYDILSSLKDLNVKYAHILHPTSRDCSYDNLSDIEVIMFDDLVDYSSAIRNVVNGLLQSRSIDGQTLPKLKSIVVIISARAEISILGEVHNSAPTAEVVIF